MSHREQKRQLQKIALTPVEVYATFGIPPGTLANLRWAKKGPRYYKRPGGRGVFYLMADVLEWITSQPVQTMDSVDTGSLSGHGSGNGDQDVEY
jgi:hypothetical protein